MTGERERIDSPWAEGEPLRSLDEIGLATVSIQTGLDLCSISRLEGVLSRQGGRFLKRVYTAQEKAYCDRYRGRRRLAALAARFAAKEACAKALGTGIWGMDGLGFTEIEVLNDDRGQPCLRLYGRADHRRREVGGTSLALSLTHEGDLAMAVCQLLCVAQSQMR